jgi:hypothetical protein
MDWAESPALESSRDNVLAAVPVPAVLIAFSYTTLRVCRGKATLDLARTERFKHYRLTVPTVSCYLI